jgi:MoxR-like ATPase
MTQKIIRPPASDLIPNPDVPYVDVHGLVEKILKEIIPHEDVPPSYILLNSSHGLGKTLMVAHIATRLGEMLDMQIPLVVHDCSDDTQEYDFLGLHIADKDGTAFQLGSFPLSIDLANECGVAILLAEEISGLPPGGQKMFNRMTDWRRGIYVPQAGRTYTLEPTSTLIIMATMNPSGYGGVYTLNKDLRSRLTEVRVPRPSREQLIKILQTVCPWARPSAITSIAQLVDESRSEATEYTISTRDAVRALRSMHRHDYAMEFPLQSVINKFEGREMNLIAEQVDAIFRTGLKAKVGSGASHI